MALLLRPWSPSDAPALYEAVNAADDLAQQFGERDLSSVEECDRFIRQVLAREAEDGVFWAIAVDGQAVGSIAVNHLEQRHQTGWVFYWLGASARGKGLAARGLASVAQWVFEVAGSYRLELGHRTNNPASCRVALAAGFAVEGIEREKLRYGDERFDVETHARLASDPAPALEPIRLTGR